MALYPCPECATSISERASACPTCGAAWQGVCPECHEFRVPNSEACRNCGYPFPKLPKIKLSTIKGSAESIARGAKTVDFKKLGFGTLWFKFWVYVRTPVAVLTYLLLGFTDPSSIPGYWGVACFFIAVAVGLHRRRYWAWKANYLLVWEPVVFTAFLPSIAGTGSRDEQIVSLLTAGLLVAIWVLPNLLYFAKRQPWFTPDVHETEIRELTLRGMLAEFWGGPPTVFRILSMLVFIFVIMGVFGFLLEELL